MEQPRRLEPDVSYSSGWSRNVEWLIGPWFLVFGGFMSVMIFVTYPENVHPHQPLPPSPYPFIAFPVLGLLFCYLAFFRSIARVEIRDKTLYWYLPFHRLRGQAPLADIVSLWTGQTISWSITRTVFVIEHSRPVSIRDQRGIKEFVAELVARESTINLEGWGPRAPIVPAQLVAFEPYFSRRSDDEDDVAERRARYAAASRQAAKASNENPTQDPK